MWSLAPTAGGVFDCSAVAASFPYREVTSFKSPRCSRTFGQSVRLHSRHHSRLLAHVRHTSGHLFLGSVVNPRLPSTRSFLSLELSPFLETSQPWAYKYLSFCPASFTARRLLGSSVVFCILVLGSCLLRPSVSLCGWTPLVSPGPWGVLAVGSVGSHEHGAVRAHEQVCVLACALVSLG